MSELDDLKRRHKTERVELLRQHDQADDDLDAEQKAEFLALRARQKAEIKALEDAED